MREYLKQICEQLRFPREAQTELLAAWGKLTANTAGTLAWQRWIDAYEQNICIDYAAAQMELDAAAAEVGVHPYTAELLFFLLLTKPLKAEYEKRGLDLAIWQNSCMDLRWKLMECKQEYGIWGSFVAPWFVSFFTLKRFALGRLQFELTDFPEEYELAGRKKPKGIEKVVSVHIPSAGKLNHKDCLDSYQRAAAFFADAFEGDMVVFMCESWLLFPEHKTMLGEHSGIVEFMKDYDVYRVWETEGDLWRIFGQENCSDVNSLPEKTSLQRAYKDLLLRGKRAGVGEGIFFYPKAR